MKSLIAVALRGGEPVSESVGAVSVDLGDSGVDIPAAVLLGVAVTAVEDDTYGEEVIDFLEGNALDLHLSPDGEAPLDSGLHLVLEPHLVKACLQGGSEAMEEVFTTGLALLDLALDLVIRIGMLVAEAQVLKLRLDGEEAETIS